MTTYRAAALSSAKSTFEQQAEQLLLVARKIDDTFNSAVELICRGEGRLIVSGMGKSGHIGKKIFATLVSTGTPSFFLHPAEAFHGDLGLILPNDIFLGISNSGETEELLKLIPFLKDNGNLIIAMTGNPKSSLATASEFHLDIGVSQEACPLQLAPTSSTTATLVMGDALAIALMEAREFKPENFARFHPGGSLGRKLLGKVSDYYIDASSVHHGADFKTILGCMASSSGGIICVIDDNLDLLGVITDGDIRRKLSSGELEQLLRLKAKDIMSTSPKLVSKDTRCSDADSLMAELGINSLLVKGDNKNLYIYQNLNRKDK